MCQDMCHRGSCNCSQDQKSCGCGYQNHFERRFQTREERIAELEEYLAELQAETRAVNEQIAQMQAG